MREACLCEEMETVEQMFDQLIWGTFCLLGLVLYLFSPILPMRRGRKNLQGNGGPNVDISLLKVIKRVEREGKGKLLNVDLTSSFSGLLRLWCQRRTDVLAY